MTLTQKETNFINDLKSQEQLCIEKYTRYASQACDPQLQSLFTDLGNTERGHLDTLNQLANGTVPAVGGGSSAVKTQKNFKASSCDQQGKDNDKFLCSDALAMEKHVSSEYDTSIFEFCSQDVRSVLNHIQKEEQQHGEELYSYMAVNGMYNA